MIIDAYRYAAVDTGLIGPYLSGLWGGYSLDLLRGAYAGDCLRLRRSNDNAEQDIGFSSGVIDASAIASFVGSNSAYVVTWYDQSGGGNDLSQPTTANQPRLVNAGTIADFATFDGSNDAMESVNNCGTPSSITVFLAGSIRNAGASTVPHSLGNPQNSRGAQFVASGTDDLSIGLTGSGGFDAGSNYYIRDFSNTLDSGSHVFSLSYLPTETVSVKAALHIDGAAQSGGISFPGSLSSAFSAAKHVLGARLVNGALATDMDCRTFLIYEADKAADIVAISAALA